MGRAKNAMELTIYQKYLMHGQQQPNIVASGTNCRCCQEQNSMYHTSCQSPSKKGRSSQRLIPYNNEASMGNECRRKNAQFFSSDTIFFIHLFSPHLFEISFYFQRICIDLSYIVYIYFHTVMMMMNIYYYNTELIPNEHTTYINTYCFVISLL